MFEATRVFSERNDSTQMSEWYFQAREGIVGPYESRQAAENALKAFIASCKERGCDGGRGGEKKSGLTLEPLEPSDCPFVFEPSRRKRGIDSLN